MALIKCPECNKEISDKSKSCLNCGCPIMDAARTNSVRIKIPNNIVQGWVGLFSSRATKITDDNNNLLWEGLHGQNANFTVDHSTNIIINLGKWANNVEGVVSPGKKYALSQDMGAHMYATFRLTEVDVIDSE